MIPYPIDEPVTRIGKIKKAMEAEGLSALFVYSLQWKLEYVHYVSNHRLMGPSACVVLPLDGDPVLYISEAGDLDRALQESWVKDIRTFDGGDIREPLTEACKWGKKIGIVGLRIFNTVQYSLLGQFSDMEFIDALPILDRVAMIKSPWEIELLRRGGELADKGFLYCLSAARPGLKEFELAAELNFAMEKEGADDNFQMFSVGKGLDCMHVPRENVIAEGDFILAEITPLLGSINYAAQLCRSIKVGAASSLEKDKYQLLTEALESALDLMRPGVRMKEIALIQNKIIGSHGYEKYCNPPFMRSRGHNFGLGQYELVTDNEMELQPGMAMVVHPNQFIPETGYLACGETVCVTETGIRRMSGLPAKLYEVKGCEA